MLAASSFVLDARRLALAVPLTMLLGCNPKMIELDTDGEGSTTSVTDSVTDSMGTFGPNGMVDDSSDGSDTGPAPTERAVDILFVIDNSGSMGEEQATLVAGIESLLAVLDGAAPAVDYRIAVTTTDNGNPWCGTTTPEAGSFRATSCRSRPAEFVFNGAIQIDVFEEACGSVCNLETLQLTEPWVDVASSTGTTNVGGDAVLDTLRCMLPQGIDGCGFEQPLESMHKAIQRMTSPADMAFGFRRPGALLAVVIVTDEADCSHNATYDTIFLPDGNRVFWSDPASAAPTSAVCWNAGVACSGGDCVAASYDVNGNPVADANADTDAVLRPVQRYVDQLLGEGAYVMAINGVSSDGTVIYQESLADPQFQADFGIGPGCSSPAGLAVPPVRVREMIEAVSGTGNLRSICEGSLGPALQFLGQEVVVRLP